MNLLICCCFEIKVGLDDGDKDGNVEGMRVGNVEGITDGMLVGKEVG